MSAGYRGDTYRCDRPVWPACLSAGGLVYPAGETGGNLAVGTFSTEDYWTFFLDCLPCIQVENLSTIYEYITENRVVLKFLNSGYNFSNQITFLVFVFETTPPSVYWSHNLNTKTTNVANKTTTMLKYPQMSSMLAESELCVALVRVGEVCIVTIC